LPDLGLDKTPQEQVAKERKKEMPAAHDSEVNLFCLLHDNKIESAGRSATRGESNMNIR